MMQILCWQDQIIPKGYLAVIYTFCITINALYIFTLVRVQRSTKSYLLTTVILFLIVSDSTLATFFCVNRIYH
jgi:hypothetical protein